MITNFSTRSRSTIHGLKQNYSYSVSGSYSDFSSNFMSDFYSDSDFSSASMNLVIFVIFILYLHSPK